MSEEKDDPSEGKLKEIMDSPSVAEGFDRIDGKSEGQGSDDPSHKTDTGGVKIAQPPQPVLEVKPPSLGDSGEMINPDDAKSLNTTPTEPTSRTEKLAEKYSNMSSGDFSNSFSRATGRKM